MSKNVIRKIKIIFLVIGIVLLCCLQYWWTKKDGEYYYRYTVHKKYEPFRVLKSTNTSSLYSEKDFNEIIDKYFDVDEELKLSIKDNSYIIPGLKRTRSIQDNTSNEIDICGSMTPQGVALTESYVLISAYCYTKEHNSVLYVIDRNTHEFIKEIVMPDKSHVGSVAYDDKNQNIWVCSYEDNDNVAFVCAISLQHLEEYDLDSLRLPIKYDMEYQIDTQTRTSFMNYYDNSLYVGLFRKDADKETTIQEFELDENGGIKTTMNQMTSVYDEEPMETALPSSLFYINGKAQGMALSDDKIVITQSYGSDGISKLLVFNNEKNDDGNVDARNSNVINTIELPVMAEDCFMDPEGNMYICFESAGFAYKARKCEHVDRIIFIPREVYS